MIFFCDGLKSKYLMHEGGKSGCIKSKRNASTLFLVYIMLLFAVSSCHSNSVSKEEPKPVSDDSLISLNKEMVNEEQEEITDYISRYGYTMESTETGLHYLLLNKGHGRAPVFRSTVTLKYKVNFLNGDYCYSSDSSGVLKFILGQSDEPTGLQEGLMKLKEGGKALFIIPSYLAYGLTGDANKIGRNQTLVYHVELLKVE